MNYIEVKIPKPGDPIRLDLLVAELGDAGFESFAEEEEVLLAYVPEAEYDPEKLLDTLGAAYSDKEIKVTRIVDRNWNEIWEQNYPPVMIDGQCSIRASFHEVPEGARFDILLNPKMAFGTAHHETTAMMISMMLTSDFAGKSILDMGCGTGVLAILAARMGARRIVAIDNDPWAYENSQENALLNGLDTIEVKAGDASSLPGTEPFHFILANINKNILMRDIPAYTAVLKGEGRLFLSGFFTGDAEDITRTCEQNGLKFVTRKSKNDWAAMIFQKQ